MQDPEAPAGAPLLHVRPLRLADGAPVTAPTFPSFLMYVMVSLACTPLSNSHRRYLSRTITARGQTTVSAGRRTSFSC